MSWVKTLLRRSRAATVDGLTGPARVDRDPRVLAERLRRGDIAVIDQVDLDRATASLLVSKGAAAVVNASPTLSGRYPSLGATVLVDAGVEILDTVGVDVLTTVRDGTSLRIVDDRLLAGESEVAVGTRQSAETVTASLAAAEAGLSSQMAAFAASAGEYLRREHRLLLEPGTIPALRTSIAGRDTVVVVPGPDHREDLARLRKYAKEYQPAVIAVDEAADTARDLGYKPTVIVGDLSNVSDEAIREAGDIVVCLDGDTGAGGLARIDRMGVARTPLTTTVRPQELALLLADEAGAQVIIAAGTDRTLVSMLDSGRTNAAADFVTRLRVGSRLLDAQAVAAMYRPRIAGWLVTLLLLMAVLALGVAAWLTPTGNDAISNLTQTVSDTVDTIRGTSPEEPSP
jgi:uncharacterized membrane-anchored protein